MPFVLEDEFSIQPSGALFYKNSGCPAIYEQRSQIGDVYNAKLVCLPDGSALLVGGSTDPECLNPIEICKRNGKPVKSLNVPRGNVALAVGLLRAEHSNGFGKDYVFAIGGCAEKEPMTAVERYSIKADVWMSLPELNYARVSSSVAVLADYLYVFGGRNTSGYVPQIERLNLKNINSRFEVIECQLITPAVDIGIVPATSGSELMLLGGFNG
jgi:hypothetical protein